jgi:hypothetical protein
LRSRGLNADKKSAQSVLAQVRQRSMRAKRVVNTEELLEFYRRAGDGVDPIDLPMEMRYDCA